MRASIYLVICLSISYIIILLCLPGPTYAQNPPSSPDYKMLDYGFGAGGVASAASNIYSLFGTLGDADQGSPSSSNYFIGAGLEYEITATQAAAPTFTNPNNYYNKLHIVVNKGGNNPTDYEYAIALSATDAAHFKYVLPDHTLTDSLSNSNFQSYALWNSSTGFDVVDLLPGTTYYARVTTRQGRFFTQGSWSPIATAATVQPTLSFDINIGTTDTPSSPPYILNIGNLSAGAVTASSQRAFIDVSSNSTNGVFISVNGTNNGLLSSSTSQTIPSTTNDLTAQTSGYGAQYYSVAQTSGGPMEALSPYNSALNTNNVGVVDTSKRYIFDSSQNQVAGGSVGFQLKAKASNTTASANDYSDILTILVTGSF